MQIGDSIALVTGANRGLGLAFTRELVRRGAARVYGAARQQDQVTEPGVTPVGLDITDQDRVAEVARQCADVSLLVNNAGVMKASTFTGAPSLEAARAEMETNYFGTLSMCRAFAPVLAASGPKDSPEDVVRQALDAVEAGQVEVLADERTRTVKASLSRDHDLIYPPIQQFWDAAIMGTG
jgi:NAD(P)-dependent dehydrogenase (short-subunit alcohol dehydrogenase family)